LKDFAKKRDEGGEVSKAGSFFKAHTAIIHQINST